ncbi:F-box protein [Thalictrum thalictroides]|uniref:F-box protein n=1 Tax=Thalictrum thalictroides TaxID=46969 RepID=A0A7J6W7K9_THATH|nr:F-box protein [Thalictrum thalictroides]
MAAHQDSDGFDRISDDLILLIFNKLSDIKTLTRYRSVSKRFNSLVPQVENLLLKVDCVISSENNEWILLHVFKSLLHSLQDLISSKRFTSSSSSSSSSIQPSSPSEILRGFEKIKRLEIELPSGDLRLEKGTVLRWKAEFGKSLKSCVILAIRSIEMNGEDCNNGDDDVEIDFNGDNGGGGLKLRVVWTISALIAASARHYLLREVIKEHKEIESLVLNDREGEGTVVMDKQGLKEFRQGGEEGDAAHISTVGWKNRTTVPAVRMRMRHVSNMDLPGGVRIRGATLVVVRPTDGKENLKTEIEDKMEDRNSAMGVFNGVFEEVVCALLKKPSYLLEMNSF